jgi:serine/threonine protein kinase
MDKFVIVEQINVKGNVYLIEDDIKNKFIMKIVPYEKNEYESKCLKRLKDICDIKILCYIDEFMMTIDNEEYKAIILEYDPNYIDLMEYINKYNVKSDEFEKIFMQIEDIVKTIHSKNVMHGDINERNIMINPMNLNVKIIDFGKCRIIEDNNFMQDDLQVEYLKEFLKNYFME